MSTLQATPMDVNVTSATQLLALLPEDVQRTIPSDLLWFKPTAAALRIMATIRDQRIWEHLHQVSIDWETLLSTARRGEYSRSVEVRLELAASLAGYGDARPDLREAARVLDRTNCTAVSNALRIAQGPWSR